MKLISKIIVILLVNVLLILFTSNLVIAGFSAEVKHKAKSVSNLVGSSSLAQNNQDDRKTLETIVNEWSLHDVKWTREQLENLVRKNPTNYVAWYWIAVASHRDLDDSKRAKEALAKIIKAQPKQPTWLLPWSYFRLGMVASSEGQTDKAIKLFNKVLLFKNDGSGFYYAAQDELSKLENLED